MTTNKITTLAIITLTILGLINSASAEWLNYDYPTTATPKTLMYDKDLHEKYKGFEVVPRENGEGYLKITPKFVNLYPEEYSEGGARASLYDLYSRQLSFSSEEGQEARFEFVEESYQGDYLRIMNNFFYALMKESININEKIVSTPLLKEKYNVKYYDQQVLKYQRYAKAIKNLSNKISIEKREKLWNQKLLPMLDEKVRAFNYKKSPYEKWANDQNLDIIIILLEFYRQMDPSEENNYYLTDASKKLIIKYGGIESFYQELSPIGWHKPSRTNDYLRPSDPTCVYIEKNWYEINNWKIKTFGCGLLYSVSENNMYIIGNGLNNGIVTTLEEWNENDYNKKPRDLYFPDGNANSRNLTLKQKEERIYQLEMNSQDWPQKYKKQLIDAGWTYDEYNKYAKNFLENYVWK